MLSPHCNYNHGGYERNISSFAGESTIVPRKEMPAKKQERLRQTTKELEDSTAYIDWKQNFYDEVLSGKRPYVSNLIRTEND